jgi:ankyrin repeat protein
VSIKSADVPRKKPAAVPTDDLTLLDAMKDQITDPNHDLGFELRRAAAVGNTARIHALLSAGADVDILNGAPLRWGVRHRQTDAVRLLIDHGAQLTFHEQDLLTMAAQNGDAQTLCVLLPLLSRPYDSELLDHALVEAVKSRDRATVKALLDAGANPTAKNHDPVMIAATNGDSPLLRLLHIHGADVSAHDSQAVVAAVVAKQPQALNLLLALGANSHAQNGIPLRLAISQGDAEIVEILIRAGEKVPDPAWIINAAQSDSVETLVMLAAHGADWSPLADDLLYQAAQSGNARMLAYIFAEALVLDPTVINQALEPAARTASGQVLKLLLSNGADPMTDNSAALRAAIDAKEFGVARLLLQAGARAKDLPGSVIAPVFEEDASFAIELLRGGVSVQDAQFSPLSSARFTLKVPPEAVVLADDGEPHPEPIRTARLLLARTLATKAAKQQETTAVSATIWLSEVLDAAGR